MYLFALEIFGPSTENKKANNLLEYQRLLKRCVRCKRKTFKRLLHKMAKRIPMEDKCLPVHGACDLNEMYVKTPRKKIA